MSSHSAALKHSVELSFDPVHYFPLLGCGPLQSFGLLVASVDAAPVKPTHMFEARWQAIVVSIRTVAVASGTVLTLLLQEFKFL